jgi:hypothetical protein
MPPERPSLEGKVSTLPFCVAPPDAAKSRACCSNRRREADAATPIAWFCARYATVRVARFQASRRKGPKQCLQNCELLRSLRSPAPPPSLSTIVAHAA